MKRQRIGRISRSIIRKEPPIVREEGWTIQEPVYDLEWHENFIRNQYRLEIRPAPWYIRLWRRVTA